ncbi:MAG: hypothetical protein HLUCCO07_05020, partial [Rhodobacteraceae bacterium HLUCCO07]
MARAQGARAQMALAFETTYGTLPASGFTKMPFASTSLGAEQPLLNSELLGYGRDPLAPIKDAVTADGDVVVPLDAEAFGFWLKAAFGAPTTTGVEAPYSHEFQSGSWTLPSMSIETGMPEVPRYAMYSGWRDTAYVVFEELDLSPFGNRIPQLSFEVFAPVADPDTAEGLTQAVTMIPASGEFTYATQAIRKGGSGAQPHPERWWRGRSGDRRSRRCRGRAGHSGRDPIRDPAACALPRHAPVGVHWRGPDRYRGRDPCP